MGTGSSTQNEDSQGNEEKGDGEEDHSGGQLYVSLKMENYRRKGELIPHVYGSDPLVASWDSCKALSMERETTSMWELSFVVPPNHETLDFKFLLKPKYSNTPCIVEEGMNRVLTGGTLQGDARMAIFKVSSDEVLEYRVFIKADRVSPFDLAASWRAYQENLQPSTVRGIPDVTINAAPSLGVENGSTSSLELDLEHYVVPAPMTTANSGMAYAANFTETPRSIIHGGVCSSSEASHNSSHSSKTVGISVDRSAPGKEMEIIIPDTSKVFPSSSMVESKSVGTFSPLQKQDSLRGLFVDRGVGSPRLAKSASATTFDLKLDSDTKNAMPAAAGAVAAAAVADQMLGPKEDRHLAIVLVGLPARGKTFTAAKLTRYLRWLGHSTKHFNVGKYRRLKHGTNQSADFFRADNPEGMEARNELHYAVALYPVKSAGLPLDGFPLGVPIGVSTFRVTVNYSIILIVTIPYWVLFSVLVAALAMDDMTAWMQEGGQVGIFDATNSTRIRRNMLMKMAEGKCKIIFLETLCNDERIIERNIRLKIQQSPDYAEVEDFEAGLQDFKTRLANYEKVYEPVEEGSYIKMIDMASGQGGQIQVNNISGYLPGRIVFFLVNTHLTPRPILLTRHGESRDNVRGRIGGDTVISDSGEVYAKKLANFVEKRLKSERTASIWTSTLQRTILTASPIVGFPKCRSRKKDKLRYRYPRGESYLDVIQRLEPVIIELERQRAPVVVISHQAVLRALYAYFADRPLKEIPHIEVPLHTIIEIQMGVTGVQEKRYKLMD
ncbi:hypothetical protein IFM89_012276 [Coptis chinensis]|uniref:CBM20 domain-containing protein n=1 Tax=Coptis chinensis TaxID=261450 RepID=A0A835LIY4_9MAGN|nr:hypothetical protein IFM89_012276 [Coptis chinensis]